MRFRRTTVMAVVVAMLTVPTTAFADDDVAERGTTDSTVVTDAERDALHDRAFEAAKQRALETIEKQLRALDGLSSKVAGSRFITNEHAAALHGDIARAIGGLETLSNEIEAATTWPRLRALIEKIDDWKIAQVLAPKTTQVIASDSLVAASRKLETYSGMLENVIGRFEDAGHDVDEAWRLLEEMDDQIAEGFRLADPVAENVIGLTAADWPDPAEGILGQGRTDLKAAGDSLKSAHRTAVQIVHFLRNLFDGQTDLDA